MPPPNSKPGPRNAGTPRIPNINVDSLAQRYESDVNEEQDGEVGELIDPVIVSMVDLQKRAARIYDI